ncbi:MAG: DivIVA domain-containing protein [Eubacteriales bacterium]
MAKDFRKKTFQKILRGYSPDEVDAYLSYIIDEFKKLERRNSENERKLAAALQKLDEINLEKSKYEGTPEVTEAEKTADSIIKKANEDAEAIRAGASKAAEEAVREAAEEAASEAEKIIAEAEAYSEKVRGAADGLSKTAGDMYDEIISFRDSLFELYNSHIESIEKMTNSAEDFSDRIDELYPSDETDEDYVEDENEDITDSDESETEPDEETTDAASQTEEDDAGTSDENSGRDLYIDLEDEYAEDGGADEEYINDALGLEDDEEEVLPDEDLSENGDESVISEADEVRRRQLDKFFGILNDEELLGAEDDDALAEEDDFIGDETRVLDIGNLLREGRKEKEKSDSAQTDDFNSEDGEGNYVEMDSIFDGKEGRDLSLTDEFDIVYSNKNAKKSVDEIRRQPTVAPSAPQKKSGKWHKK